MTALHQFVDLLERAGLPLDAEALADGLWLAVQIAAEQQVLPPPLPAPAEPIVVEHTAPSAPSAGPQAAAGEHIPPPEPPVEPPDGKVAPEEEPFPEASAPLYADSRALLGGNGSVEIAFATPQASALPGRLAIARALRPLMRRLPSRTRQQFDETATVQRIAEAELWVPALKAARERWYELVLVVDGSPSVLIWRQAINDFQQLLARHGAFRDVRCWTLLTGEAGFVLRRGIDITGNDGLPATGAELFDAQNRKLVLLVSDCAAPPWRDGRMATLLHTWGERGLVTLVQLLPEALWSRSGLGRMAAGSIGQAPQTLHNRALAFVERRRPLGALRARGMALPVVTLEPELLAQWAALAAGSTGLDLPARWLTTEASRTVAPMPAPQSANERVERFYASASEEALQLARLLAAAAPLNLHVMRLVQQAMLPDTRQIHLAEVFLSGLLRRETGQAPTADPETTLYDFVAGVREQLLAGASTDLSVQVLNVVSQYISERLGEPFDFRAWLASPAPGELAAEDPRRPFARLAATLLRGLGGEYALLAQRLAGESSAVFLNETSEDVEEIEQPEPQPQSWARLEMRVRQRAWEHYTLEMRYYPVGATNFEHYGPADIRLSEQLIAARTLDAKAYGALLTEMLFAAPGSTAWFVQCLDHSAEQQQPLNIALLDEGNALLSNIKWELLQHPQQNWFLSYQKPTVITRYVRAKRVIPPINKARAIDLQLLVAVGTYSGFSLFDTYPFTYNEENWIRPSLDVIPFKVIEFTGLHSINQAMQKDVDILYFSCYSSSRKGETQLLLDNDEGGKLIVNRNMLDGFFTSLSKPPSVVIFVTNNTQVVDAVVEPLGAMITRAGVPLAVVIQGSITAEMHSFFMSTFFAEVQRHGNALQAIGAARFAMQSQSDWWVPVLYTSRTDGQLWKVDSQPNPE
jgi:hypothetical protein